MRGPTASPEERLPLTPAVFHILLTLADGEMHGYAIMREVERSTGGKVRMGPGTLYGAVKKLLANAVIEEADGPGDNERDDERRRYYRLTGLGVRVLNSELSRLRQILQHARRKKFVAPRGAAI